MAYALLILLWTAQEGRCAGYASINLGAIAAAEQTRRLADVTVFEPTGLPRHRTAILKFSWADSFVGCNIAHVQP